jgi:hypothetical protein
MDVLTALSPVKLALISAVACTLVLFSRRSRKHLPPGPPLEPFIGQLRTLPTEHQWETFAAWGKEWGK